MIAPVARLSRPMVVLVAVVALGVLADGVVVVAHLTSATRSHAPSTSSAQGGAKASAGQHPCNHGFYVSQAAHARKGGAYVKQVAGSDLGKNGNCTAPLPSPQQTSKPDQAGD